MFIVREKERCFLGESAVITVYFSLTLLIMMSILFTLLESARSEGLKLKAQMIASASVESVFASYDTHLFENYGLLFFAGKDSSGAELESIALDYAKKNADENNAKRTWLACRAEEVNALNYVLATDAGGDVFIRAVCDYMKGAGLLETAASAATDIFRADTTVSNSDGEIDVGKVKENVKNTEEAILNSEEDEESEIKIDNEDALKEEYENSKNDLKAWSQKGILSLVCDNAKDISDKSYALDDAPSSLNNERKKRTCADIEDVSAADILLFDQYVFNNFNSYSKDDGKRLEIEYLICEKDSDLSNLSSIAKRIVAIRFGVDYAKIRNDSNKVASAYAIGTAVAGWTGIPSLVTAVKETVLVMWALADGISDTKKIFAGEKDDKGMSYDDYLRGFLLLKDSEDKSYRAMDVIQWNIRSEEESFAFSNCIYAARIKLLVSSNKLFPLLPAPISYSFNMESAYSYGTVLKYW